MLRRGAGAGDQESRREPGEAAGVSRGDEARPGKRRPGGEDRPVADPSREPGRGELERRHAARVARLEDADGRIVEAERRLPDREEDIEQVREAVVEDMRAVRDGDRPPA